MHPALDQLSKVPLLQHFSDHLIQLFLLTVITYLACKYVKESFFSNLPPGPIGLPIVGYRPFLGKYPQKKLAELSKKYGGMLSMRFGPKLFVIVNDYEILKEAYSHPMALDRDKETFEHIIDSGFAISNGEEWEEQRRFCMQSVKNLGLGRGQWEEMIQEEAGCFIEKLKSFKGEPTDFQSDLGSSVNNNVLALLLGRRLKKGIDDKLIEVTNNFSYVTVSFTEAHSVISMTPWLRKLLEWLKIAGFDFAAKTIVDFNDLLRKEVKNHRSDEEQSNANDFINLYLKKLDALELQNSKHYFSVRNLVGNVKILFLGGADTIFVSLGWLFRLMAAHPDVQRRVHDELDDVIGHDGKVSYEERFKVPYTVAVLMEGQRYGSTAPLPFRLARNDFIVRGYTIPKGTGIMGNLYALHHDPKYWKEPEKFNPNRFLSEDKKKFLSNLPGFAPFSVGRRNCPGETVAWMEILNYFAAVMQKFQIVAPPGVKIHFEVTQGLISRLKPQPLCFIERT